MSKPRSGSELDQASVSQLGVGGEKVPEQWSAAVAEYPQKLSSSQLLEAQVERTPEALAVRWDLHRLTYRQLNEQANQLARVLQKRGVELETPVGIFMNRSVEMILAMIAICKAGGSYVPLDPSYPRERLAFILTDAAVSLVLSHTSVAADAPRGSWQVLCVDHGEVKDELAQHPRHNLPSRAHGDSRAYIIYTSGSTGQPKGVEILHRGIGRLVMNTDYIQLDASDRVAQISNASFDAATFEIWAPLCNGAQVVGINRDISLSPRAFAARITEEGLTAVFLTTALFNLVAQEVPEAFRSLRHLLVGGEAHNPYWVAHVLQHGPPERFLNVYGPTESTTFASWHLVTEPPTTAIPIGRPISNTRLYILDSELRPLPIGVPGELYIGGDGLARGYLNRPELNRECFQESPYLNGERLYKTGDQARWLPEGAIDFLGRLDQQVKIRGFRIEPGEVRATILEHPAVGDAAVVVREETPGEKQLVAYLVPKEGELTALAGSALAGSVNAFLVSKLPQFMIPRHYVPLRVLPLTINGKLDREALPAPTTQRQSEAADLALPKGNTELRIASLWCKLLRSEQAYLSDNFFASGGNSLLAAQLQLRIQDEFLIEVPIYTIFAQPTLGEIAQAVDAQLRSRGTRVAPPKEADLSAEAVLEADIIPCAAYQPTAEPPRNILLTGATGFLGAYLLNRLLRRTAAQIYCLVRCASDGEAFAKLEKALRKHRLWDPALRARIVPVRGDLTRVRFGLDPVLFNALAGHLDAVYHCGAHVSYVQPYSTHRRANVVGTREVLRFACVGQVKLVHYISSIAVFGPIGYFKDLPGLDEDTPIDPSESVMPFDMGYSQSKWVAEKMVLSAKERGLPVIIYRPGFIMGDSATGSTNVEDFMSRLVIGCLEIGSYPDLPTGRKEFTPVDYTSDAIVHIAQDPSSVGKIFHLVPPESAESPSIVKFFESITNFGYDLKKLSYAHWQEQLSHHVRDKAGHVLLPLLPIFSERIYQGTLTRWELYEKMPRYRSQNTDQALRGSGVVYPLMGRKLVETYLAFLIQNRLIPPPGRGPSDPVRRSASFSAIEPAHRAQV